MIKKIVLLITILLANFGFAQENTASPYSFYGIGSARFKGTNDFVNMGGISVYSDSTHINVLNPASYSNQLITTFQVGMTSSFYNLNTASASEKAKKTTFDYMVMGFPVSKKVGVSLGLLPQSAVGYRLSSDTRSVNGLFKQYKGKGGVNKVFVGAGYQITPKFSVGLDFQYLFGILNTQSDVFDQTIIYGSREINESTVSGLAVNAGLNFKTKFNNKLNFFSSLTYAPEAKLNSINTRNVSLVSALANGSIVAASADTEVNVADTKLIVPSKLAIGAGLGNRKWFLGGDVAFSGTGNQVNRFENYSNVSYENGVKVAIGGFFIPKFDSYNNYFQRVTYRGGFKYENTGLVINNTAIKDKSVTLGFGLPISGTFSSLNLGAEYGSRGTTGNGLIKENYFSINIGLLFNDKWFRKTLYN
ncbi:hypothetical protein [Flavobacterium sp.]|uniref:hypothetical protein n=1 Tax=Flavobacterium sp. TaxID=239 RepID=UPI001B4287D5|nr:hypothetical protein [Flavobacterium sp.]MBP6127475.1 hypothetical protein [Flavobacterium sp.]